MNDFTTNYNHLTLGLALANRLYSTDDGNPIYRLLMNTADAELGVNVRHLVGSWPATLAVLATVIVLNAEVFRSALKADGSAEAMDFLTWLPAEG